jgi:hypothetical protein
LLDPFDSYSVDVIESDITGVAGDIVVLSDDEFEMPNSDSVITRLIL